METIIFNFFYNWKEYVMKLFRNKEQDVSLDIKILLSRVIVRLDRICEHLDEQKIQSEENAIKGKGKQDKYKQYQNEEGLYGKKKDDILK